MEVSALPFPGFLMVISLPLLVFQLHYQKAAQLQDIQHPLLRMGITQRIAPYSVIRLNCTIAFGRQLPGKLRPATTANRRAAYNPEFQDH
jgi:hypothetical protein